MWLDNLTTQLEVVGLLFGIAIYLVKTYLSTKAPASAQALIDRLTHQPNEHLMRSDTMHIYVYMQSIYNN